MLLADKQRLSLPFMLPADPANERDMELFSLQRLPLPDEMESPELREQLVSRLTAHDASLPTLLEHYAGRDALYGRAISNSLQSVSQFLDALEQSDLSSTERTHLLKTRLQLLGQQEDSPQSSEVTMSESAKEWQAYLDTARHFYEGHFSEALTGFMALQEAKAPWIAETASYMVMRTHLNAAVKDAQSEYGDTDFTKSDKEALKQAMTQGLSYLTAYPQGRYVSSTKGMFRRINWMAGDQASLRDNYSEAIAADHSLPELEALVNEIDLSLLSADAYRNELAYEDKTQPELLFINALCGLRTGYDQKRNWSDEQIDEAIQQLQETGKTEEATYLQAYRLLQNQQFDAVLALLPKTEG